MPHLVEYAGPDRRTEIAVVIPVLERLAPEEHVVGVQRSEVIHARHLAGWSEVALVRRTDLWIPRTKIGPVRPNRLVLVVRELTGCSRSFPNITSVSLPE